MIRPSRLRPRRVTVSIRWEIQDAVQLEVLDERGGLRGHKVAGDRASGDAVGIGNVCVIGGVKLTVGCPPSTVYKVNLHSRIAM